jgi:RNase adaptor protein for sRNA GlmZ degradation
MKISSFGFNDMAKVPDSQNTVLFDCRDLPMPRVNESGMEEATRDDVLQHTVAQDLVEQAVSVAVNAPRDVAFGCMSGFQRSVVLAEEVARRVRDTGVEVEVEHRSLDPIFLGTEEN